jgi:hypothetical protein
VRGSSTDGRNQNLILIKKQKDKEPTVVLSARATSHFIPRGKRQREGNRKTEGSSSTQSRGDQAKRIRIKKRCSSSSSLPPL